MTANMQAIMLLNYSIFSNNVKYTTIWILIKKALSIKKELLIFFYKKSSTNYSK